MIKAVTESYLKECLAWLSGAGEFEEYALSPCDTGTHPKEKDFTLLYSSSGGRVAIYGRKVGFDTVAASRDGKELYFDKKLFGRCKGEADLGKSIYDGIIAEFKLPCIRPEQTGSRFGEILASISEKQKSIGHPEYIPIPCHLGKERYIVRGVFGREYLQQFIGVLEQDMAEVLHLGLELTNVLRQQRKVQKSQRYDGRHRNIWP